MLLSCSWRSLMMRWYCCSNPLCGTYCVTRCVGKSDCEKCCSKYFTKKIFPVEERKIDGAHELFLAISNRSTPHICSPCVRVMEVNWLTTVVKVVRERLWKNYNLSSEVKRATKCQDGWAKRLLAVIHTTMLWILLISGRVDHMGLIITSLNFSFMSKWTKSKQIWDRKK
jgi:hypothetical protein